MPCTDDQTTSINSTASAMATDPATQPPSQTEAFSDSASNAGDSSSPSASSRPAKRAAPEQGAVAPAHDTPNDSIAQLTAAMALMQQQQQQQQLIMQQQQQQNAMLQQTVSTMAGQLQQVLPALPAAANALQSTANALTAERPGANAGLSDNDEENSRLTAASANAVDAALKASTNRLRAINTAKYAATQGSKALAELDPAKTDIPLPRSLPKELRAKEPRISRGGSLPASDFADLQEELLVKQRTYIFDSCTLFVKAKERVAELCEKQQTEEEATLKGTLTELFTDTVVPREEADAEVTAALRSYELKKKQLTRDIESQRRAEETERSKKSAAMEKEKLRRAQEAEANRESVHAVARHVAREEVALQAAKGDRSHAPQAEEDAMEADEDGNSNADEEDLVERSQQEAAIEKKILRQSTTKKKSGGDGTAQSKGSSGNGKPGGKKTSPLGASNRGNGNAATNRGRGARGRSKRGGGRGAR